MPSLVESNQCCNVDYDIKHDTAKFGENPTIFSKVVLIQNCFFCAYHTEVNSLTCLTHTHTLQTTRE